MLHALSPSTDRPVAWTPDAEILVGRWTADPRADEISADGRKIKLEPLKMRLLLALAQHAGDVVLTQELLDTVWAGVVVTSASVYQGIAQLRRQLADGDPNTAYIETVPRKGYRLVAPVTWRQRDPPPALPDAPPAQADAPVEPAEPAPPAARARLRRRWLLAGTAGALAAAAGGAAWQLAGLRRPPGPVRLAVLPFADRSRGGGEEALAEGVTRDVIRALERNPHVDVVAFDSVLALGRSAAERLADVSSRLSSAFALVGDLVRAGQQVRLAVRLLALPGELLRWEQVFDEPLGALQRLPDHIAAAAATALQVATPPAAAQPASGAGDAYELYVLGEHAARLRTAASYAKARDYFERGIALDPAYALNYIGLGSTWILQTTHGTGIDRAQAFARATPLFDKALRLDPQSAQAQTAQGLLATAAGRYADARTWIERALKTSPGFAQAHLSLGNVELADGWPRRAVPHFARSAALDPLALAPHLNHGVAAAQVASPAEADAAFRRVVALMPQHADGYWGLGINAYAQGALDVAANRYRDALQREPGRPFLWYELAWIDLDLGLHDAAAAAFARTVDQLPASQHWPAVHAAYAWLADPRRGAAPAVLALTPAQVPQDIAAIDVMMIRLLAGLPLDAALLQRALDAMDSVGSDAEPLPWFVFQGRHALVDWATVEFALGHAQRAATLLDRAEAGVQRLQRQGNAGHALHFHRARIHGLRGQNDAALAALTSAVDGGCRRGWWIRLDPAFAAVRADRRFGALLARVDGLMARQRAAA